VRPFLTRVQIPPSIARQRLVIFGEITAFLQVGALVMLSYYLPLWFQTIKDDTPLVSGVDVLPTAISQSIAGIAVGKLGMDRLQPPPNLLTKRSRCNEVLHTVGAFRMRVCGCRIRSHDYLYDLNSCGAMDWVPNPRWSWTRYRSADGMLEDPVR
jgi:hypothetical protein